MEETCIDRERQTLEMSDVLRTEEKYPLNSVTSRMLLARLCAVMQKDEYMKSSDGYIVRSLYFDSISDRDYFEKESGLLCRKKVRLRVYGDGAQSAKLEWKQKQGAFQRKRSLMINREDAQALIHGDYGCLRNYPEPIAEEFYAMMTGWLYRPKCIVQYERIAYINTINNIRITLDSNIQSHEGYFDLFGEEIPLYPVSPPDSVILEVKYNHFLLSYIKNVISPYVEMQAAVSKYGAARKYGLGGLL